jgi:hypothetical protein
MDESFMRARHARPLYALRAGSLWPSSSPLDTPSRAGLTPERLPDRGVNLEIPI